MVAYGGTHADQAGFRTVIVGLPLVANTMSPEKTFTGGGAFTTTLFAAVRFAVVCDASEGAATMHARSRHSSAAPLLTWTIAAGARLSRVFGFELCDQLW